MYECTLCLHSILLGKDHQRQKIAAENFSCTYQSKHSNLFRYTCNPQVSQTKVPYDQTDLDNDKNFYEHVLVNAYHSFKTKS